MTNEEAEVVVEALMVIPFFPSAPAAQAVVANQLAHMCGTLKDGMWLVGRAAQLHPTWSKCGINGLWQIWFSKHPPRNEAERVLDLTVGSTETYPEGVPSEKHTRPELEAPKMRQLPQGHVVSVDPECEQLISDLAREVSERAAAERAPRKKLLLVKVSAPITAEEVERTRQEELQRRKSEVTRV